VRSYPVKYVVPMLIAVTQAEIKRRAAKDGSGDADQPKD
jgi:hypothetical protein